MAVLRTVLGVNVCALFVCVQEIEICLNKRSDEPAGPSSDMTVESNIVRANQNYNNYCSMNY